MLRIWATLMKNQKIIQDMVLEYPQTDDRMEIIKQSLNDFALAFDISRPIWLPKNESDLQRFPVTRFFPDQFIDSVSFDCMVLEIIGEEKKKK